MTPAIIIFGNAIILSYCALTGRWHDWVFLWLLEPLILAAAVVIPINLNKRIEGQVVYWTKASSLTLTILAVLLALSTCWLSFIVTLFT